MPHAMRLGQSYSGELIRAKGVRCLYLSAACCDSAVKRFRSAFAQKCVG